MRALLFPGQGTQSVGMGQVLARGFPTATAVFDEAEEIAPAIPTLMKRGPAETLARTENAQLAVTTVNLAALSVLIESDVDFEVAAGHSVGLLSALVAAGSLRRRDALALAAARGSLMGQLPGGTGMVSVLGVEPRDAVALADGIARELGETLVVSLVNGPTTVVFGGSAAALAVLTARVDGEATRITRLPVSHAFHSPFMRPARARWAEIVAHHPIDDPQCTVLADADGRVLTTAEQIRTALVDQFTTAVRWDLVSERLLAIGVTAAYEVGDSKTLRSLARPYDGLAVDSMAMVTTLSALRSRKAVECSR